MDNTPYIVQEGRGPGFYILSEHRKLARDQVAFAAGLNLGPATVIAFNAAGDAVQLVPGATDSTGVAAGITYDKVISTTTPVQGVITARESEVYDLYIVWPAGITPAEQATATAQLAALHIILRDSI